MCELSGKMPFFLLFYSKKVFLCKNNVEVEATYLGALLLH